MSKVCSKCGEAKELSEFYKDARKPSGYQSGCKACKKAAALQWRKRNPDKWAATLSRANAKRSGSRQVFCKNEVRKAVLSGKLTRPDTCQSCGVTCKPEAHHHDYGAPLSVTWFCPSCHRSAHGASKWRNRLLESQLHQPLVHSQHDEAAIDC